MWALKCTKFGMMAVIASLMVAFSAGTLLAAPASNKTTIAPLAKGKKIFKTKAAHKFAKAAIKNNAKMIKVTLRVILVSKRGKYIDPRIRKVVKRLRKLYKFKSYRLAQTRILRIALKKSVRASLPFKKELKLSYLGIKNGRRKMIRLSIQMKHRISVSVANGGTVLQGLTTKKGKSLILAISASIL